MYNSKRLNDLTAALMYCTAKRGFFSTGERICINQERAALLANEPQTDAMIAEGLPPSEPREIPQHSDKLQRKLDGFIDDMQRNGWSPKNL